MEKLLLISIHNVYATKNMPIEVLNIFGSVKVSNNIPRGAPITPNKMNGLSFVSGDTEPPTALARLYLEDGTTLVGKSFGCHESVEGEVSQHVGTDHELFPIIEREIRLVCWCCTNIANSVRIPT